MCSVIPHPTRLRRSYGVASTAASTVVTARSPRDESVQVADVARAKTKIQKERQKRGQCLFRTYLAKVVATLLWSVNSFVNPLS